MQFVFAALLVIVGNPFCRQARASDSAARPNVILILTDDQGWGDMGFHGNQQIKTPHLDRLASQSVELEQFYVCPVCSPTRAGLLTGRYHYRTGIVDTNMGRSMMHADEVTLAEMLGQAGYRTGIFGKWHLGDNYPLRPNDQGFQESFVHRGGGIGQPADPPGNRYFDPVVEHNGQPHATKGYASDVFTEAAMKFIAESRDEPFFAYLAFNCPHVPLQVPDDYVRPYQQAGLDERTSKVYGMVTNIDDNLGRLFAQLDELQLTKRTIVVFLCDNGPEGQRYTGVFRGAKTTLYEAGLRSPCLIRWPEKLPGGRKIAQTAAYIDLAPTLLAACNVKPPDDVELDGIDLMPTLTAGQPLPERSLCFQWHRGDEPELYRAFAIRRGQYKLVQPNGGDPARVPLQADFALYDLSSDPGEQRNLIKTYPDIAEKLKEDYRRWFADVSATRGYAPPRIHLGTDHEDPVTLTRQDWRGPRAGWSDTSLGHWEVEVTRTGAFDVTVRMPKTESDSTVHLRIGALSRDARLPQGATEYTFRAVPLEQGPGRVEAYIPRAGQNVGVHYVDVRKAAAGVGD